MVQREKQTEKGIEVTKRALTHLKQSKREERGVPFHIDVRANVNKTAFTIAGSGTIPIRGVYQGSLHFSKLPPDFHPVVITAYVYSICCFYYAATRNGALNMRDLGVSGYETERNLTFPGGNSIKIVGKVESSRNAVGFKGEMHGSVSVPKDIIGHSCYLTYLRPEGGGRILGRGEGSCFCESGKDFPVKIETLHTFDKSKSLAAPQYRIVTDHGILDGLSYVFTLHSVLDRVNTMSKISAGTISSVT
jgi:hypothetical protein